MRRIRKDDPDAKIIMFSMNDDPAFVVRAVEMGAQGYVSKSDDPRVLSRPCAKWRREKISSRRIWRKPLLSRAPRSRPVPPSQMTPRELEILRLLGSGDKIVEVADALDISYKTVANTTSLLKQKLGAKNHSDLIRIAVEMGLADHLATSHRKLPSPGRRDRSHHEIRFARAMGGRKCGCSEVSYQLSTMWRQP